MKGNIYKPDLFLISFFIFVRSLVTSEESQNPRGPSPIEPPNTRPQPSRRDREERQRDGRALRESAVAETRHRSRDYPQIQRVAADIGESVNSLSRYCSVEPESKPICVP